MISKQAAPLRNRQQRRAIAAEYFSAPEREKRRVEAKREAWAERKLAEVLEALKVGLEEIEFSPLDAGVPV